MNMFEREVINIYNEKIEIVKEILDQLYMSISLDKYLHTSEIENGINYLDLYKDDRIYFRARKIIYENISVDLPKISWINKDMKIISFHPYHEESDYRYIIKFDWDKRVFSVFYGRV